MNESWDAIVIGLGSAALQMAYLGHSHPEWKKKRMLFIDPNPSSAKAWCFWHKGEHPMDRFVDYSWAQFHIGTKKHQHTRQAGSYSYRHISSSRLYDWFHTEALQQISNWRFTQEKVIACESDGQQWQVGTEENIYTAKHIYDSRLQKADLKPPYIAQHFRGWVVQAEQPVFDTSKATFMDFSLTWQQPVPTFVYVLPFTAHRALVETTVFSTQVWKKEDYDSITKQYLKDKYQGVEFQVVGEENGVIPMAFPKESQSALPNYTKIGGAGGGIKPTTGYAFNRIHRSLSAVMQHHKTIAAANRFPFYDSLLLSIIDQEPEKVAGIFERLFHKNKMETILRFLDEDSSLMDEARIFANLPWSPFLRALGKKWSLIK